MLSVSSLLPSLFLDRMRSLLGAEFPHFVEALDRPADGLRVNSLRLSAADFEQLSPFPLQPSPFPLSAYLLNELQAPGRHPYHAAGLFYLQDPGAMVVGALVDPQPGDRVLDLCAAPGGKTTHLAGLMQGGGILVANDVNGARARELVGNVERCGVRNAIVMSESPLRLSQSFGAWFDRVLVDAPCSGESMFHKSASARADWSPSAVTGCARRQDDLLETASQLVAPGGRLVYSTCTFSREENEEVVERFLRRNGGFRPEALLEIEAGQALTFGGVSRSGYRLWPHHFPGAGHFVAALRREDGVREERPASRLAPLDRTALEHLETFLDGTLPDPALPSDRLHGIGQHVYLLPEESPETKSLRVLRSGLLLGTLERGRFEPAHALALAAPLPNFARRVSLEVGDRRVEEYLAGHPIEGEGPPGWLPVTVDGFALGWGKRVGRTIKNHYPKGLRQRG